MISSYRLRKRHHHHHQITQDKFQMVILQPVQRHIVQNADVNLTRAWTFFFSQWSTVNAHLSVLQDRLQAVISLADERTLISPISSPRGIYGALQNGTFLSDHPPRAVLQDNVAEAAQLGALAQLFKVMVSHQCFFVSQWSFHQSKSISFCRTWCLLLIA